MMTYEEALAFIHGAYGKGEKRGLENMHRLLALLGDPHKAFRSIHVAGTNGKGSVCAFLQAILRCAGYRTGLYTSPFLQRYNERMRIDGVPISDDTLAALTDRVAAAVTQLNTREVYPTEFEIGTAIAFLYFAQSDIDIAVIEVGLGGRLDPTNVIEPCVSVIATIGLDHTRILGDTLTAIAGEKAGIIKPGVPLVLSAQNGADVRQVVMRRCEEVGAPYTLAKPTVGLPLGIPGPHQQYNAAVAVAAIEKLTGFAVTQAQIAEGLSRARWPGRLEWIAQTPPVLLDGAHNGQGAQALAAYVGQLPPAKCVLVCGVLRDKDWEAMTAAFAGAADEAIAVMPDSNRALPQDALRERFESLGVRAQEAASVTEALALAAQAAGPQGRVVVAGSLYLVGEARTLLTPEQDALLAPAKNG